MAPRVLDRRPAPQTVSPAHPMRTLLGAPKRPRTNSWAHWQLDQGDQGACTVFAALMEAAARPQPFYGDPAVSKIDVERLNQWAKTHGYKWVQQNDEWPGESPAYEGSSLNAACKLGRAVGWWEGWRWALGAPQNQVNDVVMTIGYHGPVMMASTWRSGMWEADAQDRLNYVGDDEGGHAYLLTKFSVTRQAVWTPNSWGGAGQGWISLQDLAFMFHEGGEAAVAVGRKVLATRSAA